MEEQEAEERGGRLFQNSAKGRRCKKSKAIQLGKVEVKSANL